MQTTSVGAGQQVLSVEHQCIGLMNPLNGQVLAHDN